MPTGAQRIIALVNNKGGVGKTTSALNMAAGLAMRQRQVLLIDLDPQANASLAVLGPEALQLPTAMDDVLLEPGSALREIIRPTPLPGLDLAPSHARLANAELNLATIRGRETLLKRRMDEGLQAYHYIFIDCPPSLGLLTVNALTAATEVYLPIAMTYFALEGVGQVLRTIQAVQRDLGHPTLALTGVIATFYDRRTKLSEEILQSIRTHFTTVVFQTTIRRNVKLDEAQSHHQAIFAYAPRSTGAVEYGQLVEEVLQREATSSRRQSSRADAR